MKRSVVIDKRESYCIYALVNSFFGNQFIDLNSAKDISGAQQEFKTNTLQFHEKFFSIDDVTLESQLMVSYRKINSTSENNINYRVTSQSNHCCQLASEIEKDLFLNEELIHVQIILVTLRNTEVGCRRCSRLMKKTYNFLKRHQQDDNQLSLVNLWGE